LAQRAESLRAIGPEDALEGRRPLFLLRFSGVSLLRFADLAFSGELFQLPPRFERLAEHQGPHPDVASSAQAQRSMCRVDRASACPTCASVERTDCS